MGRIRMSVEARRQQLLEIGLQMLTSNSYDDVWVERVAERAGVSRGLLYHYFPTKKDFVHEVVRAEAARLLELIATEISVGADVPMRLALGLDAYLAYVQTHQDSYRLLHAGALTHDEEVRKILEDALQVQEDRIVAALGVSQVSLLLRTAVRGWMAYTISVCLSWLDNPSLTQEQVLALCAQTFLATVEVAAIS